MSGSTGGVVRQLVTELVYRLNGFREADRAFDSLRAKAERIGDVRFRATGVQQVEAAITRLRDMARQAVSVPVRGAVGTVGRVAAPAVAAPAVPPMQVRLQGVGEANAALASLRSMAQSAAVAVAGIGAALSVRKLVEAGDQMTAGLDRLRAELDGTGASAEAMYERLYGLGRQTGIAADTGVTAFTNMHSAVREMGGTAEQVLTVISGIQKAGAVSGAKATDVAEVLRQTSQALSGGVLNGEELRILKERLGPFAREFAQAMGVPYGQLKKLGSEGKLVADKIFPAMLAAAQKFDDKFSRTVVTFDRAKNIANVTLTRFLADLDKAIGLSNALARGLTAFSDWLEGLRSQLPVVQRFVHGLGGVDQALEVIAASAAAASLALTPLMAKLIVPTAVVAGLVAVGLAVQDIYTWVRGRPGSLAEELFGDFGAVRDRALAALGEARARIEAVIGPIGQIADRVRAELAAAWDATRRDWDLLVRGFATGREWVTANWTEIAGAASALASELRARWETTRAEWAGLMGAITGSAQWVRENWAGISAFFSDSFGIIGRQGEALWNALRPVLEGVAGGPAKLREAWGPVGGFFAGLINGIIGMFADLGGRISSVVDTVARAAERVRQALIGMGFMSAVPGVAPPMVQALPPGVGPRPADGLDRVAPGTPGMGKITPNMMRRPELEGLGLYKPSSFVPDLSGRMFRGQAGYNASQSNQITQHVNITATGGSPAEVAAAAQSGVNRANRDAFGASDAFARNLGFDMSRVEAAAA